MHFQKRKCTPVPGSARDSSIEKKLTVHKFYKQLTKRGMQSQDSPPQVVAPLVHRPQPAVVQPQPKRGATVKIETDVSQSTTVGPLYSNTEQPARQRSDDKRTRFRSLSQRSDVHDAFLHSDMADTKTAALIGDGHAFGKKHAASPREKVNLQPISP